MPQVYDALSYYYEHKNEIDSTWKAAIQETEGMKKMHSSILEKKLGKIKNYKRDCINEMLKQDFGISGIIYDGALKIAKEARNKGND